ncbi:hypothetical protein Cob_v009400 [Colletotrichum orbiculare MAFF 240422]|uniref:Uncharacterized protein n=1 Tax=Colletotrichum orbiculare (strain 104-T / ATCC 96160 / CBS 514.97 / LARS 414 / MAFF 240422) TaxID=1213857 RepID=N4VQ66_COLOR|nr:hypothetical protein Cob_v009400 [Colletotrichum orbiculare MAFF 240422]
MASNGEGASEGPSQLTPREHEILKNAWSSLKSPPEVDYTRLAAACGMTNSRSAYNAWTRIKTKLFTAPPADEDNGATGAAPSAASTPKRKRAAPKKKNAAAPAVEANNEEDDELNAETEEKLNVATPAKKRRATPKKSAAAVLNDDEATAGDEDSGAPATPVKGKRAAPKRKTPAKTAAVKKQETEEVAEEEVPVEGAASPAKTEAQLAVEGGGDSVMEDGEM